MGLPRAYLVCLLFVKHSFAETGPGGALRGWLATGKYSAPVRSQLSKFESNLKIITIALSLSSSLRAHLGTFVLLALERFFFAWPSWS